MIDIVGGEVLQKVGSVGGITRAYIWGRNVCVVTKEEERVLVDVSGLELGMAKGRVRVAFIVTGFLVTANGGVDDGGVRGDGGCMRVHDGAEEGEGGGFRQGERRGTKLGC